MIQSWEHRQQAAEARARMFADLLEDEKGQAPNQVDQQQNAASKPSAKSLKRSKGQADADAQELDDLFSKMDNKAASSFVSARVFRLSVGGGLKSCVLGAVASSLAFSQAQQGQ